MACPSYSYTLKWSDHQSIIACAVQDLNNFPDVTLVCGETRINANRLLLSACSPFFHSLLKDNCDNPIIISMPDTNFNHIHRLFSFIQTGEYTTISDDLDQVFDTANQLELNCFTLKYPHKSCSKGEGFNFFNFDAVLENSMETKCLKKPNKKVVKDNDISDEGDKVWDKESYQMRLTMMMKTSASKGKVGGKTCWSCSLCGLQFGTRRRRYVLRHMESHLHGRLHCQECGKSFKTIDCLKRHPCRASELKHESIAKKENVAATEIVSSSNTGLDNGEEQINAVRTVEKYLVEDDYSKETTVVERRTVENNNMANAEENGYCEEMTNVERRMVVNNNLAITEDDNIEALINEEKTVGNMMSKDNLIGDKCVSVAQFYGGKSVQDKIVNSADDDSIVNPTEGDSILSPFVEVNNPHKSNVVDDIPGDNTVTIKATAVQEDKKKMIVSQQMAKVDTDWYCLICGKFWPGMSMCKRHLETHLSESKM